MSSAKKKKTQKKPKPAGEEETGLKFSLKIGRNDRGEQEIHMIDKEPDEKDLEALDDDEGIPMVKPRKRHQSDAANESSNSIQKMEENSNQMSNSKALDMKDQEEGSIQFDAGADLQQIAMSSRRWAQKWIRVPNVWEHMPDLWVLKWVKVGTVPLREPERQVKEKEASKFYKCKYEECAKVFTDYTSMKKHMMTHGERQFVCTVPGCGKKFLDNSKLRRHQLVHTGERPYKCDICGKLFSLDFNLRTHLRTHTGERPYFCRYPGCGRRFTQSSNLSAHEKVHYQKETSGTAGILNEEEQP